MGRAFAVIPARGGSKGLPGKHLLDLGGKPLIAWTIQAAQQAASIDDLVVTSDDPAILAVAAGLGVPVLERPATLARDDTPSEPVVEHALAARASEDPEITVLLQPTSPLRGSEDIEAALSLLRGDVDCVISVREPPINPWKCFYRTGAGYLAGIVDDTAPFRPRQSLPTALMPNGAIYAVRTACFRRTGRFFGPRTLPFLMPAERSVDIDVQTDLDAARRQLAGA